MEVIEENKRCCVGCLCTEDEFHLQQLSIQCEPLKAIFQVDTILLCYLCKRIAQHADLFIQNVQSNQILLENFHGDLSSSIQTVRAQVQPSVNLLPVQLDSIVLTGVDDVEADKECCSIISSKDLRIKLEMKEEGLDHLEGEFIDGSDDFHDSIVKEEDDFPLNSFLKEEIGLDSIDLKSLGKTLNKKAKKKEGSQIKDRIEKKLIKIDNITGPHRKVILVKKTLSTSTELPNNYIVMHITEKQCMKERDKRTRDKTYLNSTYKCVDCVKGFMLKDSYDRHKEKHRLNRGRFRCTICNQRFESAVKLTGHKKSHTIRYKCSECDLTRVSHCSIKEHYATKHNNDYGCYKCLYCPKVFNRELSQRKHQAYCHSGRDRVTCEVCHKTYVSKDSLLSHILRKHPTERSSDVYRKRYVCQKCGVAFIAPSQLRNHSVVHSELRAFYCVECDRNFKTAAGLAHHLKTAAPHVSYSELPLACEHCDKRFAIKRDLVRHKNRVHLNIKPFTCDKCDKAYINSWSLREHKLYNHDGAKRPLRYPCSMCDKVFDRSSILKAHMRTHTGERPYQCSRCPAQFAQSSALGTHVKLVHLKLTRDGRPKPGSLK